MSETAAAYENRSLFSDYYLSERLADHPQWAEDVSEPFKVALKLYQSRRDVLEGMNEGQTEAEFIRPLLAKVLGFAFDVQTPASRQGKLNRPDYTLFLDQELKRSAQAVREDQGRYFARAAAVADAKFWGRPLDQRISDPREELSNINPSFQIVNYLVATGVDWGILTNGRLWRLYYAKARSRVDTYFEVDLVIALEMGDVDAFRVFYQFFRAAAFRPGPGTDRSFLEAVYEGSATYGAQLQDRLKKLIFKEIFLDLATGFLELRNQDGDYSAETQESLDEVFEGTLRLLYRLLFLLHAEARGLLPVDERRGYYQYSLTRLKLQIARRIDQGGALSRVSTDFWDDLNGLFRVIDRGDPELNVPRYNGGLFRQGDPRNAFLEEHRVADHYLAPALDHLTRELDPETGQRRFIDYKSLDVEQLGSIYEGLLEFKLRVADEDLAVVKEKGREVYRAASEVDDPQEIIKAGQPYLENDKGERKATGSYYTPHYIVEYIVEHTLGPVLERRAERFRELMAEIEPKRARLAEIEENLAQDPERQDATVSRWQNERTGLERELEPLETETREALLGLRVCDPAMGSGHFLVYAVDWLAERLIALLNEYPDNPLLRKLARTREDILAELKRQGVTIEVERLKDTSLLKRAVMKRCIYGVDLNPMATELAKLSLWLDSFTVGAPLSFLDHHLKTGNSLIGTTVDEVREAMEGSGKQMTLFGSQFAGLLRAAELMRGVATRVDATFADVEASAEQYAEFENEMRPYKQVLNIWVARHFGARQVESFLQDHGRELLGPEERPGVHDSEVYKEATRLTAEQRFFHWELEFPEVFVDLERAEWKDQPGFDAVVGNPPYDVIERERLGEREPHARLSAYLEDSRTFEAASGGKQNLFRPFLVVSSNLIHSKGAFGQIIPLALLTDTTCADTLQFLLRRDRSVQIQAFPQKDDARNRVFYEAKLSTCIFVASGSIDPGQVRVQTNPGREIVRTAKSYAATLGELEEISDERLAIPLASQAEWDLICQLHQDPSMVSLDQVVDLARGEINQTIFRKYITSDPHCEEMLKGSEVGPYSVHSPSQGSKEWFDNELYEQDTGTRKEPPHLRLAVQRITGVDDSRRLTGTLIDRPAHFADSLNSIVARDKQVLLAILAILNSVVLNWRFSIFSTNNNVSIAELEQLPVPRGKLVYRSSQTTSARSKLMEHYQAGDHAAFVQGIQELLLAGERQPKDPPQGDPGARSVADSPLLDVISALSEDRLEQAQTRHNLTMSFDHFKYLNRASAMGEVSGILADEIQSGHRISGHRDIDVTSHPHDPDGLRLLRESSSSSTLEILLKLRDPDADWQSWQYEEDGRSIKREWVPAYRFEMDEQKARYYQCAFEVLDEFANFTSFPGGYTRTAQQKLMATKIPLYDPDVDLTPLVELRQELEEVERKIERTDALIDQIVYKLYGLTEEEIAIVEGETASASN